MSQVEVATMLSAVFGYAQQWLRGFKWYNDGVTLLVSLVLGALGSFWVVTNYADGGRTFMWTTVQMALTILGGTAVGHMAAQVPSAVMLAPKFNQFNEGGTK